MVIYILLHLNKSKKEREELYYKAFGIKCNIMPDNCIKLVFEDPNAKRLVFNSKNEQILTFPFRNAKHIFYKTIKMLQFTLNHLVEKNYFI